MVSKRKAVNVISFSGSSSNGCVEMSFVFGWSDSRKVQPTYLALEQRPNLVLHALCFAQQALVDVQPLQPPLATAHVVDLGGAIFDGASEQVFGVGADIVALSLD